MKTLFELLSEIDDPRRDVVLRIYRDHEDLFHANPGSSHIHQCWEGGLADHLADMFRLCLLEYDLLTTYIAGRASLPFTLGSAQVVIFCHDAEKVIVYGNSADSRCSRYIEGVGSPGEKYFKERVKHGILCDWSNDYGLHLTHDERNAIRYTHGEGDDYRNDRRVMCELAAFVGNIDRTSARILYDFGKDLG